MSLLDLNKAMTLFGPGRGILCPKFLSCGASSFSMLPVKHKQSKIRTQNVCMAEFKP